MQLKQFKTGFDVAEFNQFIRTHIIEQFNFQEDGSVNVFYRDPASPGKSPIELIAAISDAVVGKSQSIVAGEKIDIEKNKTFIKSLIEKQAAFKPDQPEYRDIEAKIKSTELQIKASNETIEEYELKISMATEAINGILARI